MLRSIPICLILSTAIAADEGAAVLPRKQPAEDKGIKSLESTIPAALKLVNRNVRQRYVPHPSVAGHGRKARSGRLSTAAQDLG
jgi:hypothetical protein